MMVREFQKMNTKMFSSLSIKLIKGDFIKAPSPSNYFNIAFLLHTLEHAENPLGFIKKVHRITYMCF